VRGAAAPSSKPYLVARDLLAHLISKTIITIAHKTTEYNPP